MEKMNLSKKTTKEKARRASAGRKVSRGATGLNVGSVLSSGTNVNQKKKAGVNVPG
jgi:hypothetical protein